MGKPIRNSASLTGFFLAGVLLAALAIPLGAESPGRYFVLDNGLRVFLYEKRDLPLLHVVTAFDVGSKNETDETSGLVHMLEHCLLFRGRAARSGAGVDAEIRRHGAYFNAHTGQDISLFEISLPAEHAEFALRNQKDMLFDLDLNQAELDAEKEVMLEEYSQMEDDPQRSAADLVLQALFAGHAYGRSVYGRREVIRSATAGELLAFYRKFFVADNCALAVVGDFPAPDMERLVRSVYGPLPRTDLKPQAFPMAVPLKKRVSQRFERDVKEGYLFIAFAAPDYNHADKSAMSVLAEVLGRGVNPLLPALLRGERDSAQTVSMSYLAFRYGGAAIVSIKVNPKDITAIQRAAVDNLRRVQSESFSPDDFMPDDEMFAFDYLGSAKNQIKFAVGQAEESGLQLAGSMAGHMLLNTREKPGRFLEEIAGVDSNDLRKTAARYLSKGEFAAISIVPRKGDIK